jgi:hypothetical protein
LCIKMGMRDCKELREATEVYLQNKGLSAADLSTLATLGSVLPVLERLGLYEPSGSAGPDGVQRLAEGLVAGSLPAVTELSTYAMRVGVAGASALAAALDRGGEAPCRGSRASLWPTPPSATRRWWPSRRPCGGGPRWRLSTSMATGSATRASPPSWRRRHLQARRRRRLEG